MGEDRPESMLPAEVAETQWMLPPVAISFVQPPKDRFPEKALPPEVAKQAVMDMRNLDEIPRLNLATFVTTYMEPAAEEIFMRTWNVNAADAAQYPSCKEMEKRCVAMLAHLYHSPAGEPCGAATVGCTEACLLSGLAAKKGWQARRREAGKPTDRPNLVIGSNYQVCWKKFSLYFEVELRAVPVKGEHNLVMHMPDARQHVDENTIGVVAIFGSTYNGHLEDVAALDSIIEDLNKEHGWQVPILVDAASGGFVAPFLYPDLAWDFRLKNVHSISVSGHKFGLVYPGVGWVIYRDKAALPDEMVLMTSYLGKPEPTVSINFSRNAAQVAASYYNIIRLGKSGYKTTMLSTMRTANMLAKELLATGHFKLQGEPKLPVVAFSLKNKRPYDEFDIMYRIREYRWMLPAYTAPEGAEDIKLLRAVIRIDVTADMIQDLVKHITEVVDWLEEHYGDQDPKRVEQIKKRFQKHDPSADLGL